jgi:polygalacturonase
MRRDVSNLSFLDSYGQLRQFDPSWISRYSESGPDAEYALLLANKAVMKSLQRKMKSLRAEAKASFSHWLWLILIASILWLSLAARASDKQPKPNPTPFPTPAMTFMPTPTETHAPTSTVNDSGGQVFNVKTYGAVGNGSTDDTAAIRSAITAASATGGIVFSPPDVFVLPSRLICKSLNNVSFQGSGKSITILKSATPLGIPARNGGPTMLSFSHCANFSIRDITFDNNNIITTALQTCLVSALSSINFTVSNCEFINAKRQILAIQSSSRFWVRDNYFSCTELDGKVFAGAIMLYDNISKTSAGQIVNKRNNWSAVRRQRS